MPFSRSSVAVSWFRRISTGALSAFSVRRPTVPRSDRPWRICEPFTHTGALADYKLSDQVTLYGGWVQGWDSGFNNANNANGPDGPNSNAADANPTNNAAAANTHLQRLRTQQLQQYQEQSKGNAKANKAVLGSFGAQA